MPGRSIGMTVAPMTPVIAAAGRTPAGRATRSQYGVAWGTGGGSFGMGCIGGVVAAAACQPAVHGAGDVSTCAATAFVAGPAPVRASSGLVPVVAAPVVAGAPLLLLAPPLALLLALLLVPLLVAPLSPRLVQPLPPGSLWPVSPGFVPSTAVGIAAVAVLSAPVDRAPPEAGGGVGSCGVVVFSGMGPLQGCAGSSRDRGGPGWWVSGVGRVSPWEGRRGCGSRGRRRRWSRRAGRPPSGRWRGRGRCRRRRCGHPG